MRKTLKRMLDRLRTATNGRFRKPTSARDGLQVPQRLQGLATARLDGLIEAVLATLCET